MTVKEFRLESAARQRLLASGREALELGWPRWIEIKLKKGSLRHVSFEVETTPGTTPNSFLWVL